MDSTVSEEQERRDGGEPHGSDKDGSDKDGNDNDGNDGLGSRIEELRERIVSLNDRAKGFIKEHPAACLMGALGLGYLVARIARRRS
jgi:hypothetical protein